MWLDYHSWSSFPLSFLQHLNSWISMNRHFFRHKIKIKNFSRDFISFGKSKVKVILCSPSWNQIIFCKLFLWLLKIMKSRNFYIFKICINLHFLFFQSSSLKLILSETTFLGWRFSKHFKISCFKICPFQKLIFVEDWRKGKVWPHKCNCEKSFLHPTFSLASFPMEWMKTKSGYLKSGDFRESSCFICTT